MPSWIPRQKSVQDQLAEEVAKQEAIRFVQQSKRETPAWTPMVEPQVNLSKISNSSTNKNLTVQNTPEFDPAISVRQTPQFSPIQQEIMGFMPEEYRQSFQNVNNMGTNVYNAGANVNKPVQAISPVTQPAISQTIQPTVPEAKQPKPNVFQNVMGGVGKAFEWAKENLEKPWASILTDAWSPSLPYELGEGYIAHAKREYEAWKAPKFVKGASEATMPLYWLPYFGWAAKGARTLGFGAKAVRAIETTGKVVNLELPTEQFLNKALYGSDFGRKVALWSANKPVLSSVVKSLGGEAAFVKPNPTTQLDTVRRALVNREVVKNMAGDIQRQMIPRLAAMGDEKKILDIASDGIVGVAVPKKEGASRYLFDVLENPADYTFNSPQAEAFINEFHAIQKELVRLKTEAGMNIKGDLPVHRLVKGKFTPDGYEASEFGSKFEVARKHKTQAEGVAANIDYNNSATESLSSTIRHTINGIAKKRFDDAVKEVGETPRQLFNNTFHEKATQIEKLRGQQEAYRYGTDSLQKVISSNGSQMPGATLQKIREEYPELAQRIDDLWELRPTDVDKVLTNMSEEIRRVTKMKSRDFKVMLSKVLATQKNLGGNKIRMTDVEDVIRHLNVSEDVVSRAIEKGYRQTYRLNQARFKDGLKVLRDEARTQLSTTKDELTGLIKERRLFEKKFSEPGQILGEKSEKNPQGLYLVSMFGGKKNQLVPTEVAKFMQKVDGDKGQEWVRNVGKLSETSRLTTATLDMSAGFIQGLNVLGRDPIGWAKATAKSFEYLIKPQNFTKYMASAETQSLHNEMVKYGAKIASSEFTEGGALLTKALGKVPKIGKGLQSIEEQTIGRTQSAFLGFGQVARDNLYRVMRRPDMTPEQLTELVRTIDRMTGSMSTAAIGVGKSQREVENAFLFFAPAYTRASMAFIGDALFKGGIAGQNARQALGNLMLGGSAFYYGVAKTLGQEPNFDPSSGKFMTVSIDGQRVGVGGMMYSLARLGGNLATVENPTDLLRVDRADNPFVSFLYGKSAPITAIGTGLFLEHKDYMGKPFESPADWGRFMAEKLTPISLQKIAPWNEEKTSAPVFLGAAMGARTFPASPTEIRNDARDRYAQQQFGANYADLPKIEQKRIDANQDIKKITEEIDKRTLQLGNKLGVAFVDWRKERENARFVYEDSLNGYQQAFDDGFITANDFKELMTTEGQRLGATYEHINNLPRYKEVMTTLANKKSLDSAYLEDVAYQELVSNTQQFENEYGIFDFDRYNQFKDSLRQKYGEGVWQKVEEIKAEKDKNLPPLAKEYKKAQEAMRPYWQVADKVERLFGKRFAESSQGQAMISKQRKLLRASRPDIAKYYALFYSQQ